MVSLLLRGEGCSSSLQVWGPLCRGCLPAAHPALMGQVRQPAVGAEWQICQGCMEIPSGLRCWRELRVHGCWAYPVSSGHWPACPMLHAHTWLWSPVVQGQAETVECLTDQTALVMMLVLREGGEMQTQPRCVGQRGSQDSGWSRSGAGCAIRHAREGRAGCRQRARALLWLC